MRWLLGWLFPPEERREGSDFTASWERDLARRLAPQEYELAPPPSRSRRYLDVGAQGRKFEPIDWRWRRLNTAGVARLRRVTERG